MRITEILDLFKLHSDPKALAAFDKKESVPALATPASFLTQIITPKAESVLGVPSAQIAILTRNNCNTGIRETIFNFIETVHGNTASRNVTPGRGAKFRFRVWTIRIPFINVTVFVAQKQVIEWEPPFSDVGYPIFYVKRTDLELLRDGLRGFKF